MRSGFKFAAFAGIAVLALGSLSPADTATHSRKKSAKKEKEIVLPPLPNGPQGPVPQIPLDSIAPVPPQVSYKNGQLTIVAPNSTLADVLRAVRKQTSADIEVPPATERVVTHLGPGPAREVVAELLNGSRFNYVLLGSPQDANTLTRVVLVAKSGPENVANPAAGVVQPQPGQPQGNFAPPPQPDAQPEADASDAPAEENPDDNTDQNAAAEAEQQQPPPDAPGVRTPQQMLQEMQQRQLQMQQNQPPGQPPIPGSGIPGRPPGSEPQ
jgi:hypothetical protein